MKGIKDSMIYRQEAIDFAQQGQFKPLYTPIQVNHLLLFLLLLCLALGMTYWLFTQYFTHYQTVHGFIEPSSGLMVHRSPTGGRINAISFVQGEEVSAGQVLMLIAPLKYAADGTTAFDTQQEYLVSQLSELQQEKLRLIDIFSKKNELFSAQQQDAERQLHFLENAYKSQLSIHSMADDKYLRAKALFEQGHLAAVALFDIKEKSQQTALQLNAVARELSHEKNNLTTLFYQQKLLNADHKQLLSRNSIEQSQLQQRISELDQAGYQAVVASQSGVIDSIDVHLGDEVSPGQVLVNIVPEGSVLIGRINIPTLAAGFVAVGQAVQLRYSSYPYQKYGIFSGELISLSETPMQDERGQFFYIAHVSLSQDKVLAHGHEYKLKTGMSFEADVVLSRRTFVEWLFEPLFSLRGGSSVN